MKYTVSLTLVAYLGCFVSVASIANANSMIDTSLNSLKIAGTAPSSNTAVKEFDRTLMAEAKSYQALVQEAEGLAVQLIQQALQDHQVASIVVRVVGDRFGEVAPILTVRVTRAEWQTQPNVPAWARYGGRSSMQLLGYLEPKPQSSEGAIATAPAVVPQAEASSSAAPAPVSGPARAVQPRSRVMPGQESPIPGRIPESGDPGYR